MLCRVSYSSNLWSLIHECIFGIPKGALRGDKNKNRDYESYLFTLRLAILQQSYGRFGGAERLALPAPPPSEWRELRMYPEIVSAA